MTERLRLLWADLQSWFLRLNPRERVLVGSAAGVGVVLAIGLVLFLLASSADATRSRTEGKLRRLAEAEQLASGYAQAERARKEAESQLTASDESLISYVTTKGSQSGLDIPSINPKGDVPVGDSNIVESTVEITLTDVRLDKLVGFLSSVESGPGVVRVKFLRLEPRPKDGVLTAWSTIAGYHLKAAP